MIPYSTQHIDQEDIQAVTEALQKEYLTSGTTVNEFEEKVAQYVGAKYAVAVSSGTAALHAACAAAGIQEDDEVITTPRMQRFIVAGGLFLQILIKILTILARMRLKKKLRSIRKRLFRFIMPGSHVIWRIHMRLPKHMD